MGDVTSNDNILLKTKTQHYLEIRTSCQTLYHLSTTCCVSVLHQCSSFKLHCSLFSNASSNAIASPSGFLLQRKHLGRKRLTVGAYISCTNITGNFSGVRRLVYMMWRHNYIQIFL